MRGGEFLGTVAITGFNYYDKYWFNPSGEAARMLDGSEIRGFTIKAFILPVSLRFVRERLPALLNDLKPSIAIGLGLAPSTRESIVELASINRVSFQKDVDNYSVLYDEIIPGSPTVVQSTLPIDRILQKCRLEKDLRIKPGFGAGLFLCNVAAYIIMKYGVDNNIPAGFIHIPPSTINMLRRETEHGVPLNEIIDSVKCVIEATIESLNMGFLTTPTSYSV